MITITDAALWIGQAVMLGGGLIIAALVVSLGMGAVWQVWGRGLNAMDLYSATKEWRERHPERAARWAKRNGLGPEVD